MMLSKRNLLFTLFAVLLCFANTSKSILAQQSTSTYDGLDVIFLVDQSGSMGGPDFNSPKSQTNDPLGLRFESIQYALRTLGAYRAVVPAESLLRMSVVSFGDQTEVTLPWQEIGGTNWAAQEPQLIDQLSAATFGKRNLGNTNFGAAYSAAQNLFTQLPAGENHIRVVIVVTDGAPCAPAEFQDKSCNSPSDQTDHMNKLVAFAQSAFPPPRYELFVIGIDNTNSYWPRFAPLWGQLVGSTGTATRIESPTDIAPIFIKILANLVGSLQGTANANQTIGQSVPLTNQQATIAVPPYQQLLRITIFKTQPVPSVQITSPSTAAITTGSPNVNVTGLNSAIEIWTINNPEPGTWQLQAVPDARLIVSLDLIRANWTLDVPTTAQTRFIPFPVKLQILDANGKPLQDYADKRFSLNVNVTLTSPSGVTTKLALTTSGQGTFESQITPLEVGNYTLDLAADTLNLDGSRLQIIDAPSANKFQVSDVKIEASLSPSGNLLTSQTLQVTAQALDSGGKPIQPNGSVFNVILNSQNGENTYRMNASADNYTAEIVLDDRGQYQPTVQMLMPDANGTLQEIARQTLPTFSVEPANYVLLKLVSPQDNSTQYTTTGFPPLTPTDLEISVQTTSQDGSPLDLQSYVTGKLPIRLQVTDSDGKDVTNNAEFSATPNTGVYRAVINGLQGGTYTIAVENDTAVKLANSTLFDPRFRSDRVTVTRSTNPGFLITVGLIALAVIGSISGVTLYIVNRVRRSQHPAKGMLVIMEENSSAGMFERRKIWSASLDRFNSNHIVFKSLPLGIRRLTVNCPSDSMSRSGRINVVIDTGQRKIQATLSKGSNRSLDGVGGSNDNIMYTIEKDPQDFDY